jgi:predicted metal-dependent hydrolase
MMIKHHQRIVAALQSPRQGKSLLQLEDSEFGTITCKRSRTSHYVRLRLGADGTLKATLPTGGTLRHVQRLVDGSRDELRRLIGEHHSSQPKYQHGQQIGQSHRLEITKALPGAESSHKLRAQTIVVALAANVDDTSPAGQEVIRTAVKAALKREAKAYLPRQLKYLADAYGFSYEKVRYANQSGRWGSCSSSGTISLNIALMNLPLELIDYVLTHELCHTVHLHHQANFWSLVESHAPGYRELRKQLKTHNPYI